MLGVALLPVLWSSRPIMHSRKAMHTLGCFASKLWYYSDWDLALAAVRVTWSWGNWREHLPFIKGRSVWLWILLQTLPVLVSVLLLWRDTTKKATLIEENIYSGVTYSLVHYPHSGSMVSCRQTWCYRGSWECSIWIWKPVPQWLTSSNEAMPPNASHVVPLPNDQALKYMSVWGLFLFQALHFSRPSLSSFFLLGVGGWERHIRPVREFNG